MGLAAPKNRSKISNDPQNTTWTTNTSRFGHRILASQGWKPGDSLGAAGASHAAHYTIASQSHIRVFLKEDNLGLGAKRGSERAENFGLAGLESILGRLNGKEEEIKKEEERQEEIEKRAYMNRKYGLMNFVSGGFLVGDQITKKADIKPALVARSEIKAQSESENVTQKEKDRKRKRDDSKKDGSKEENHADEPKLKRKKKTSMSSREGTEKAIEKGGERARHDKSKMVKEEKKKNKKTKKNDKREGSKVSSSSDLETTNPESPAAASDLEPLVDKVKRKAERKRRRGEKKLKKALQKGSAGPAGSSNSSDVDSESSKKSSELYSAPVAGTSTPVLSSAGLTFSAANMRGMHAVRQRWIRQKRAVTMDAQAMREIFMIKSPP